MSNQVNMITAFHYLVLVLYFVLLLFDIFVYIFMYTLLRCLFSNTCWKDPGGSMS